MLGKLIVAASLLFSFSAQASPGVWPAAVGGVSSLQTFATQLCFTNGQCINGSGGGAVAWGDITGTLSAQTDLASALAGKQATGSYLTVLTSDVSASGPGSAAATVNSVGGSTAANVHTAELAANAATNLNTASTLVKRDGSGNFVAGVITASLTGTVTGHSTLDLPLTGGSLSGALGMIAGSSSVASLHFGTAGTGLYGPSSSTLGFDVSGAEVARFGASGLSLGTTTVDAQFHEKNTANTKTSAIVLEDNSANKYYYDSTTANQWAWGNGTNDFVAYNGTSGNAGFANIANSINAAQPGYTWDFISTESGTTPLTSLAYNTAGSALGLPILMCRNTNSTANTYCGYGMAGNSHNPMSLMYSVFGTQTSGSEAAGLHFANARSGPLTDAMILSSAGAAQLPAYGLGIGHFDSSGNLTSSALVAAEIPNLAASKITSGQGSLTTSTTGVTVTGTNAGLAAMTVNIQTASGSQPGLMSAADWAAFNAKQAAGNYITALTDDVTAAGPGSAAATIAAPIDRRYVSFVNGNDSTGVGSQTKPWKTVQKACTALSGLATINTPYTVYLSGGNNDSDAAPITCAPNINFYSDSSIQITQNFTITGGALNDGATFTNIIFTGNWTWVRNDATNLNLGWFNSSLFGTFDFEQQGAGKAGTFMIASGANTVFGNSTFNAGEVLLEGIGLGYGTWTYVDSGAAFLYVSGADLSSTIALNGGITANFYGDFADSGYAVSGTTTGSGTPSISSDAGSVPETITGAFSFVSTSHANHESYTAADASKWATSPPTNVKDALDRIAAVVGATIPIP